MLQFQIEITEYRIIMSDTFVTNNMAVLYQKLNTSNRHPQLTWYVLPLSTQSVVRFVDDAIAFATDNSMLPSSDVSARGIAAIRPSGTTDDVVFVGVVVVDSFESL